LPASLLEDRLQDEVRFSMTRPAGPEGALLLWLATGKSRSKALKLQIVAKAMVVRDSTGLCTSKQLPQDMESLLPCEFCGRRGHSGRTCGQQMRRKHRRWRHQLAPWRLFEISLPLQHEVQGLCAVLVSSSDQAALGLLRASAAPASAAAKAAQGSM
ncbi:unnamed protein product, partial [Cladocopium goreaui]